MPSNHRRTGAVAAGAWAALIAVLLWASGPESPPQWGWIAAFEEAGGDKLGHAGLFLVQAWLLCRAGPRTPAWAGACLVLAVLYGALTEAVQGFLPGRDGDLGDLAADAVGALAGVAAFARRGAKG